MTELTNVVNVHSCPKCKKLCRSYPTSRAQLHKCSAPNVPAALILPLPGEIPMGHFIDGQQEEKGLIARKLFDTIEIRKFPKPPSFFTDESC